MMLDIEDRLRNEGARWRAEQDEPVVDLSRFAGQPHRGRRGRVAVLVTAALVAIVVPAVALRGPKPRRPPHVTVTPTTPAAAPDEIALNHEILQVETMTLDGDRLWVSGYAATTGPSKPAHLQEIDTRTGNVIGDVLLPDDSPGGLHVVGGAVWLSGQQGEESTELLKVDAATHEIVKRIPGEKSGGIAYTADTVWATDGLGGLRRIDGATGRVVATIPLPLDGIYPALSVAAGPSGVWVGNGYDGNIQRIDPTTNTAGPVIHVASDLADMVEVNGSLWIGTATGDGLVEVVDGKVTRRVDLGERAFSLTTDGSALWLGSEGSHVLRVDATSGAVDRIALAPDTDSIVVAGDPTTGAVWAASATPTPRLLRVRTVP